MTEPPYLAELRLMSFPFAPKGWAQCNGQLLPINQNQALFALLGTMYGGDGRVNFAHPNLKGRAPVHIGAGLSQGEGLGEESHTLTQAEIPTHTHAINASAATGNQPAPSILAAADNVYRGPVDLIAINPATLDPVGGNQPHENRHPLLTLNWCIALQGVFPSRN